MEGSELSGKKTVLHAIDETKMKVVREVVLSDDTKCQNISIKIVDIVCEDFGLLTWPSSFVLASFLYNNNEVIVGKCVIELGAGTALPGVTAALIGARHVVLTDKSDNVKVLQNCVEVVKFNEVNNLCTVSGLTWGRFSKFFLNLPEQDIILAADIFYDKKFFDGIMATISYLFARNNNCVLFLAYHNRSVDKIIQSAFLSRNLDIEEINVSDFLDDEKYVSVMLFKVQSMIRTKCIQTK